MYTPYKAQALAHKAFLADEYKRGVLYWSRRCFAKDTPVMTEYGLKPIQDIKVGDRVWSFGHQAELKEVLKLHWFGVDQDPKPMIKFSIDGKKITVSYDHEFYSGGQWVPAYQLTWGAMAPSQRLQLELLCKQYGQALDHPASWRLQDGGDETSTRRFWVLQNGDGRQDNQSTSGSGSNLVEEPPKQTPDQSYRQQSDEQPSRESGVGNQSRKLGSYDGAGKTESERRREVRNAYSQRETSPGDFKLSESQSTDEQTGDGSRTSENLPAKAREHTAYFEGQDLEISQVRILPAAECYDLEVTDNQNYVVYDLLVGNTGKTMWSVQQLMWSCMLNQGPHHIIFKEYQHAETVAWNQYMHLIPKELIRDMNKSTLTVTFNHFTGKFQPMWGKSDCHPSQEYHAPDCDCIELKPDHNKPPASIRLLGSDKADSHRGGESYGMIFDEYQDQDRYGWDFVYQPMLLTTDGWACFMGTAKDKDSWNEMLDRAQTNEKWYWSRATWRDNPQIKPETIAELRKEAEEDQTLGAFLQEHELIPFSQQGAVYPMFSRKHRDEGGHLVKPAEVPNEGTDYVAMDFGFGEGHPLAVCFIRITRDDVWYQWDEIHGTGIQLDDALGEIRHKMGDRQLTGIIADSARPDLIDYMASKGYPVIPAPKKQNSVLSGIDLLRKRIKPKIQLTGPPRPAYFVSTNCKKTIYDWTHYRYKEIKEDRPPAELPEKRYDDSLDAIRYLELFFKFGGPKDEKIPDSSMMKELYF